ncbi:MAG: hypothetical protein AVDCRST_MAG30-2575, partial [uncultured Solirubrobacteraceae bacterium]
DPVDPRCGRPGAVPHQRRRDPHRHRAALRHRPSGGGL